jgi:hypothetical protein
VNIITKRNEERRNLHATIHSYLIKEEELHDKKKKKNLLVYYILSEIYISR